MFGVFPRLGLAHCICLRAEKKLRRHFMAFIVCVPRHRRYWIRFIIWGDISWRLHLITCNLQLVHFSSRIHDLKNREKNTRNFSEQSTSLWIWIWPALLMSRTTTGALGDSETKLNYSTSLGVPSSRHMTWKLKRVVSKLTVHGAALVSRSNLN